MASNPFARDFVIDMKEVAERFEQILEEHPVLREVTTEFREATKEEMDRFIRQFED